MAHYPLGGSGTDAQWEVAAVPPLVGGDFVTRVWWRSDGLGTARTWAEVMQQIGTSPFVEILSDQDGQLLQIPAGVYDLRGAYFFVPEGTLVAFDVLPGAELQNCSGAHGGALLFLEATTGPALTFPDTQFHVSGTAYIEIADTAHITNQGTVPAIEVATETGAVVMGLMRGGIIDHGTAPLFNLTNGDLKFIVLDNIQAATLIPDDEVTGDVASSIVIEQDGSFPSNWPLFSGYAGTLDNQAMSTDGGAGPTLNRPVATTTPIPIGCRWFDTDLGQTIVWNGSAWVALGAATRVVFSGSIVVAGANQTLQGPFTRATGERLGLAIFCADLANGDQAVIGVEAPTDTVSISLWNDSDTGDDLHLMCWNRCAGNRTIEYLVFGYAP